MKRERNKLLKVNIINTKYSGYIPSEYKISKWANKSFMKTSKCIVNLKLAKKDEINKLNKSYLKKNKDCNVLSFPLGFKLDTGQIILGDIVLCPMVVNHESKLFNIKYDNRWAHMIIHSMLHLQGFTHNTKNTQTIMENKEKKYLAALGYPNPYNED